MNLRLLDALCLVKEPSPVEEKQRKLNEGFWTENRKGSALGATRLCSGDPKRNGGSDGTRTRGLLRDRQGCASL
jgi:hypothetical protein